MFISVHNISDSEGEDQNVDQLSSETNTGNNEKQINGVKAKVNHFYITICLTLPIHILVHCL